MSGMGTPNLVSVAALVGDPSRAAMLISLLGGRALPASELARIARVTPQTASSHLAKLVSGGLITGEIYGRHRYYKLASPDVADALEALNLIAPPQPIKSLRESVQFSAIRYARTCYDHLAGEVGVRFTHHLLELGMIEPTEKEYVVTEQGHRAFRSFGVQVDELKNLRRSFARQCLDWSERRFHLAGGLGAALTDKMFELGWIERIPGGRAVRVTSTGVQGFQNEFGFVVAE